MAWNLETTGMRSTRASPTAQPAPKRVRGALAAVLVFALAGGCSVNPATGERQLSLISEQQEIAMGREAAGQVAQQIGLVDDDALQQYVEDVGQRLAAASERPDLPWQFRVVDDPTPNAFALPGGYIFVTRGLAGLLTSEAQLAAVLGHEIGHVTARHSVAQMSRAQLAQLGLGLGIILSPEIAQLGDLLGSGLQLLFLKYGRDDERESDELGFRYMLQTGYDVEQMDDVFRALLAAGEQAGASPLPDWLSSHPTEAERIRTAEGRVAALADRPADLRVDRDAYLAAIDGMIYGSNPRHGFFRGDWFYHPELIFRFRIPETWQRQNLTNAVVGVSPERDAAVELTIAPGGSPDAAARAFFGGQNVQLVGSAREELNGKPAIVSEFRAQAQGGVVRGYVAHIGHADAVYQIVAYAPEQAFPARAATLEEIVGSFSDVRDPDVLNVQPNRIDVVRLPRAMTLEEFAREFPSEVSNEELAAINQVAPGEMLAEGTLVKRVVSG